MDAVCQGNRRGRRGRLRTAKWVSACSGCEGCSDGGDQCRPRNLGGPPRPQKTGAGLRTCVIPGDSFTSRLCEDVGPSKQDGQPEQPHVHRIANSACATLLSSRSGTRAAQVLGMQAGMFPNRATSSRNSPNLPDSGLDFVEPRPSLGQVRPTSIGLPRARPNPARN